MSSDGFSRRELLTLTTRMGLGAAAATLAGCGGPIRSTPNRGYLALPQAATDGEVVLGVFSEKNMRKVCDQVLPAVSDLKWLSKGDSVFVKLSCNSPNTHPAVTAPQAVGAVVSYLKDHGAGTVYVGDQAGVEHVRLTRHRRKSSTRRMMAKNGLLAAIRKAGGKPHFFDEHGWFGYFRPAQDFSNHWERTVYLPRIVRNVDHIINLPRLGTHALAGYTCAIKNGVGWLRDDSRYLLHHRGATFFEKLAELNHFSPLRDKVRFTLTLARQALTDIGPDFGGKHDFGGTAVLAAKNMVDHDHLAAVLLPWLDRQTTSLFDIYNPYPEHSDHWNRKLVRDTWGTDRMKGYQPIVPFPLRGKLAHDVCLSRLALLQRRRVGRVIVHRRGDKFPQGLARHLERSGTPKFQVRTA